MGFTITLNTEGDQDDVEQVFDDTVRALRTVSGATVTGSLTGDASKDASEVQDDDTVIDPATGPEG